ncbi:MAG: hypothetical protein R3F34_08655 [Planctomycetota bacterium]
MLLVALLGAGLGGGPALGAQFVLGIALGTLMLRVRRTAPCALVHALYNAAALAVGPGLVAAGAGGPMAQWIPF